LRQPPHAWPAAPTAAELELGRLRRRLGVLSADISKALIFECDFPSAKDDLALAEEQVGEGRRAGACLRFACTPCPDTRAGMDACRGAWRSCRAPCTSPHIQRQL
jgi:hypothetical protein